MKPFVLLLAAVIALAARPSFAQDETRAEIVLQNQILELRHDVDTLRDQVASGAAPVQQQSPTPSAAPSSGGDITASLLDRMSQMEEQVRSLQGSVDEMHNTLQQQNADLAKQIADLSFRVQGLEGGKPAQAGNPSAPPVAVAATSTPAPQHATLAQGYAALARRDYPAAEAIARDTLAAPRALHAYDAQFLLAQSLSGEHSYQQAALAFDDSYKAQRRGAHAQDALIGLAGSLAALGAKPAACATVEKLRGEFPSARPDIRGSAAAIDRRAGCR